MNKIAVFFDADNVAAVHAPWILEELKAMGEIYLVKAFADLSARIDWVEFAKDNGIQIAHIPSGGKNASDIAMTIDVVKTLEAQSSNHFDLFALASSDSDFSALALEIRARGFKVIGFGEECKTQKNEHMRKCFSEFRFIPNTAQSEKIKLEPEHIDTFLKVFSFIFKVKKKELDSEGFLNLGALGNYLDPKTTYNLFNYEKLGEFLSDNPELGEYRQNGTEAKFRLKR